MSHEIAFTIHGRASMAYVEDAPWHGLGQRLTPGAPIETWIREAGMDYAVLDAPVQFRARDGALRAHDRRKVLYRSDSGEPLGVVGKGYNVVQPVEVLEFFRGLVAEQGFALETAGVLFRGAKYWALARTGHGARVGGRRSKDEVRGYLLLATACDGTLQTTAQFTSVRVVCNNTLTAATLSSKDKIGAIKTSHRSEFDAGDVRTRLGLDDGWKSFVERADALAATPLSDERAAEIVYGLFEDPSRDREKVMESRPVATVLQLFGGKARGADMRSSKGTAWGLVNAVTEYVDHLAGRDQDSRLRLAWFYGGNELKQRVFREAVKVAA